MLGPQKKNRWDPDTRQNQRNLHELADKTAELDPCWTRAPVL